MMQQESDERLIDSVVVVDLDPSLALFKPSCTPLPIPEQKWVSSLQLLTQTPKDPRPNSKTILLTHGVLLHVGYCQKNRPPVYQIDFVAQHSPEWIAIKTPPSIADKFGNLSLCYKAGDNPLCEPLTDLQILITERKRVNQQKQVFILPPGYKIINNNPAAHNYLIYKRMRSPLEQTFKAVLLEKYPQTSQGITLTMLPLFCFPQGIHLAKQLKGFINFNFILTTQMGDRYYCNCLTFKQTMENSLKEQLGLPLAQNIFYEKAICLVSKARYTDEFAQCLKHLYRLSMSKNDVPFHRVVSCFVDGLMLPKEPGINGMSYSYGGSNINFDTNPSYPIISERAIYCIFKFLPLSAIISIFQAILLEKKIIFVSQSKTVLGYAVEAFLAIIFPFRWEHVIIPILPSTLKQYINAPVPLIVGITPSMLDRNIESDSVIVQLDNGTLFNDQDLPPLPDKLEKQLRRKLEPFELYDEDQVKEYLENPESTYIFKMQEIEHPEFQGVIIRDCFYQFILTLMKNYKKFWKTQKYKDNKENSSIGLTQPQLLNDIFKLQDFLSDLGMTKVGSFGYKLTEGTIFTSFIQRRHQYLDDPELLFFDTCIEKKKSKKQMCLIEKPANIRYNVAKHPEPQQVKTIYAYDRFPSILGNELIKQTQITIQLDQVNEEEIELLQEFLESELKLNKKLFKQSQAEDLDYKIQSLLLDKFRERYQEHCQQMGSSKVESMRSTIVSKLRNSRQIYDRLQLFEKLYLEQNHFIDNLFGSWPYEEIQDPKIKEISKTDFLRQYLRAQAFPQDVLLCVFEEYYGYKFKNYEFLILGNCKITFLDNQELKTCQTSFQNMRNSKRKLKYAYQVYFEHFKLKNFLNKIIPTQGLAFFNYALNKLKQQNQYIWTLQTLLEWKEELQNNQKQP